MDREAAQKAIRKIAKNRGVSEAYICSEILRAWKVSQSPDKEKFHTAVDVVVYLMQCVRKGK